MLKRFLKWLYPGLQFVEPTDSTSAPAQEEIIDDDPIDRSATRKRLTNASAFRFEQPKGSAVPTMDSAAYGPGEKLNELRSTVPDSLMDWYGSQTWIGFNMCALIAQHWLVDKACAMPGRDALRQGYEIKAPDQATVDKVKEADKRYALDDNLREMIHQGRVYGQRLVLFRVLHTDPDYYEKPFNIDAVGRGMYLGMSQIDPQWITPELTGPSLADPTSPMFYEPEYYNVYNQRIHRSHLHKYVPYPVPNILKPRYQYGGASVPQRIYERVYAAERTANEGPILAMTKRLNVLQVGASAMARFKSVIERLLEWCGFRDNHGVLVVGDGESIQQHDTSLADLDAVIMTQYQLCASIAGVPSTKLLNTTPKGFNATGEYEESTYREELESVQTNDMMPLMNKHHELVAASEGLQGPITVSFEPLDSPTATEWAGINKTRADTDAVYVNAGVLTAEKVQERLAGDKNSDYHGLEFPTAPTLEESLLDGTIEEAPTMGSGA